MRVELDTSPRTRSASAVPSLWSVQARWRRRPALVASVIVCALAPRSMFLNHRPNGVKYEIRVCARDGQHSNPGRLSSRNLARRPRMAYVAHRGCTYVDSSSCEALPGTENPRDTNPVFSPDAVTRLLFIANPGGAIKRIASRVARPVTVARLTTRSDEFEGETFCSVKAPKAS